MLLLISDANILIDMEAGQLMEKLFQLPMQFAMPDILYWEEIEPGTPGLEVMGLKELPRMRMRRLPTMPSSRRSRRNQMRSNAASESFR